MRKILFWALLPLLAPAAQAQISITALDLPSDGDTLRYSTVSVMGLNLDDQMARSGPLQRWDFRSLQPNGQDIESWKNAMKTPYGFYFGGKVGLKTQDTLNLGIAALTDIYTFYAKNSTGLTAEGLGYQVSGFPLAINNTDPEIIYRLPLNYGDRDSDTYHIELGVGGLIPVSYIQSGTRYNEVDGYGKVVTPYDSFACLRVKTVIDAVDTVKNSFFPIPVPSKTIEYKWLAIRQKIPVMEIRGTEVMGVFTITEVRYRDKYRAITGPSNPLEPVVSMRLSNTLVTAGTDTVTFKGTIDNFATSISWDIQPAGTYTVVSGSSGQEDMKVIFDYPGSYSVRFSASNLFGEDDTSCTDCILVQPGTGISEETFSVRNIYPNPASTFVYLPEAARNIRLMDMSGKELMVEAAGSRLSLTAVNAGLYLLQWEDKSGLHREPLLVKP